MRSAFALLFVACTSTHTATFTIPPPATRTPDVIRLPPRPVSADETTCAASRGSCAMVVLHNDMSSSFALDDATASIDGDTIKPAELVAITPGHHELDVAMSFHFVSNCIYCYARMWKFVIRAKHGFDVDDGASITLHAFAYERGSVTTPIEERPAMRYVERFTTR